MHQHQVNIWLVNTGWSGGAYGVGERIKLKYTRAMITAVLEGALDRVEYRQLPIFGLNIPLEVPGVPSEILDPKHTWNNQDDYDIKAKTLAQSFIDNFKDFEEYASEEIMKGAPTLEAITN